jgi:hypothetical protein
MQIKKALAVNLAIETKKSSEPGSRGELLAPGAEGVLTGRLASKRFGAKRQN